MLESTLSYTSPNRLDDAGSAQGASAAEIGVYRAGASYAAHEADDEHRGDLRLLICLCAASAAVSLSALYFIVSKLNLI
jgi:hypothetical protein